MGANLEENRPPLKYMPEEQQTQFRQEGDPAFAEDTEKDNSADSSSEQTNTDQTHSPDGDNQEGANNENGSDKPGENNESKNLADHPRWKERENDWTKRFNEQEQRHVGELAKIRQEFEEKFKGINPKPESNQPVQMPSWFGGTEDQWKEFQKWNQDMISQAKTDAVKEVEERTVAEQKAIDDATKYMNDEIASIESDKELNPTNSKIDKNKLLKIVMDYKLVDTDGKWNYRAGWAIMRGQTSQPKNNKVVDEKKNIASASVGDRRAETKPPSFMTSEDFTKPGNRPW